MEGTIKMKTIVSSVLFLAVLAVSIFFLGCEEGNHLSQKKARLVGDENLKLKKQLELCNQEIRKLEELFAQYEEGEQSRTEARKKAGELSFKLLDDISTATKKNEELTRENLQLKTRIAELESELARSGDQPDAH